MPALFFSVFLLLFSSVPLYASEFNSTRALQPYHATYVATFNGMPIETERQLVKLELGYRIETTAKNLLGKMRETEHLHLDAEGRIRIDGYLLKRSFFGSKRSEKLVIDHQRNLATYTRKKKKRETPLLPEYLGPVSYQLQLRRDLLVSNSSLNYTVISHGKIKHYQFERVGEEIIATELGDIKALKIRRVRENTDRETIFWMAEQYAYLAVKVWQREDDGETYQMILKSVTFEGQ